MTESSALAPSHTRGRKSLRASLIIAFITLAAHGLALFDGVILDDYWHQKGLREHGWSFHEILRTLNITPSDFTHFWWQQKEVCWDYLRPFFIVCMKFVYVVIGRCNPMSLHAFSIILHYVSAMLVWRLCRLLTENRTWSLFGGLLFVIYPHASVTVAWPSSQNVVLQTTLLLGTILCYLRASGLCVVPANSRWSPLVRVEESPWRQSLLAPLPMGIPSHVASPLPPLGNGIEMRRGGASKGVGSANASIPPLAKKPLFFAAILWLLAVFTRENAILLPVILISLDLAFGGRRHVRARFGLYVVMGLVGCAFLTWREWMHVHPLPDVYCRRPDGNWPEYVAWLAAKYLHYVCVSVWPAPMSIGPTGRYTPWASVPGDCILMIAIVVGLAVTYHLATRGLRGCWIWPLWIGLFVFPVTAVVATPHSGYMSGVGFAIGMALAAAGCANQSRAVRRVTAGTITVLFLAAAFMAPVGRLQWRAFAAAEALVPEWVMVSPPDRAVRDVFFINPPFAAIYLKPNLVARLGPWMEDVKVNILTYAPDGFAMEHPSLVEQTSDRGFTVEVKDRAYFSRLLGRFLLEGFRGKELFQTGQEIRGADFDVKILRADAEGVWKLQFIFPRPLSDSRYCFYFGSKVCSAAKLRFAASGSQGVAPANSRWSMAPPLSDASHLQHYADLLAAGHAGAAIPLFDATLTPTKSNSIPSLIPLFSVVRHMTSALGASVWQGNWREADNKYWNSKDNGGPRSRIRKYAPRTPTPDEWRRIRDWWIAHVDDQALREIWLRRNDFEHLTYLRAEIDWDRWIASFAFRTDMYLSGSPFDNPRGR